MRVPNVKGSAVARKVERGQAFVPGVFEEVNWYEALSDGKGEDPRPAKLVVLVQKEVIPLSWMFIPKMDYLTMSASHGIFGVDR